MNNFLIGIASVIVASVLTRLVADFWHSKIAIPSIQIGFLERIDQSSGNFSQEKKLRAVDIKAESFDLYLTILADTKFPFTKGQWKTKIVIRPSHGIILPLLDVLPGEPKRYFVDSVSLLEKRIAHSRAILTKIDWAKIESKKDISFIVDINLPESNKVFSKKLILTTEGG